MSWAAYVALNDDAIAASFDDPANAPRQGGSIADPRGRRICADCQLAVAHIAAFHQDRFGPMTPLRRTRLIPTAWKVAYTQGEHHYAVPQDCQFTGRAGALYRTLIEQISALEQRRNADIDDRDLLLIAAMQTAQIWDRFEDAWQYRSKTLDQVAAARWRADTEAELLSADQEIAPAYRDRFIAYLAPERDRFWLGAVGPAKPVGDVVLTEPSDSAAALERRRPAMQAALDAGFRGAYHTILRPYPMRDGTDIVYLPQVTVYHRPSVAAWIAANPIITTDPDLFVANIVSGPPIRLDNRAQARLADLCGVLFADPRFDTEFSATPDDPLRGLTIPESLRPYVGAYRSPYVGMPRFVQP